MSITKAAALFEANIIILPYFSFYVMWSGGYN